MTTNNNAREIKKNKQSTTKLKTKKNKERKYTLNKK